MKAITFIKIIIISLALFLFLDITIGKYINKRFIKKQLIDVDTSFALKDAVYDHKFISNYNSIIGWGDFRYRLCTDSNGFRVSCNGKRNELNEFDIAFIGDSFTEGVGYEYEKTFIGLIEKKLKDKKIANLAVTSYSPSIYFTKINYLIKNDYKFKEVIVFLDLSDLPDDILCYKVKNQKVIRRNNYENCYNNFNLKDNKFGQFIKRNFKLSFLLKNFINDKILNNVGSNDKKIVNNLLNHSRSEWTYNYKKEHFNDLEFDEAISVSIKHMNDLYILLKNNSIDLSVAVYPWPGTLKNDRADNKQVKIWKEFCKLKCKKFYNFMPVFFSRIDKKIFFIKNDIHYNSLGNKIIADEFFSQYKN